MFFYSILFYSILFYSILFYSNLFYSESMGILRWGGSSIAQEVDQTPHSGLGSFFSQRTSWRRCRFMFYSSFLILFFHGMRFPLLALLAACTPDWHPARQVNGACAQIGNVLLLVKGHRWHEHYRP